MTHTREKTLLRTLLSMLPVLLLFTGSFCHAQLETATLSGRVTSIEGAAISDAHILATNIATGAVSETHTNRLGIYVLPYLQPGSYRIAVQKYGFSVVSRSNITLHVQDQVSLNLALVIGFSTQGNNTQGSYNQPFTTSLIHHPLFEAAPLNGRSLQPLLELVPGATVVYTYFTNPGQFSINGQRTSTNIFTIDGISANFGMAQGTDSTMGEGAGEALPAIAVTGGFNNLVSVDAVEEIKLQNMAVAPEFGRMPGGQISILTRSGSNAFHGSVFEYLRNGALNAVDWFTRFNNLMPTNEQQNNFGGVIGGPLWKNKAFFFFSNEELLLRLPRSSTESVPSLLARETAPSGTRELLRAFPLPNRTGANNLAGVYAGSYSNSSTVFANSFRIDMTPSPRWSYFVRYNKGDSEGSQRGAFGFYTLSTVSHTIADVGTVTFGLTSRFNHFLNSLRINRSTYESGTYVTSDSYGGAIAPTLDYLYQSYPAATNKGNVFVATFRPDANGFYVGTDMRNFQKQWNLVDQAQWLFSSHSIALGVDLRKLTPVNAYRPYDIYAQFSGFADILRSNLTTLSVTSSESNLQRLLFRNLSAYIQDTWRPHSSATITYGLRWEFDPPPFDRAGYRYYALKNVHEPSQLQFASANTPAWQSQYKNLAPRLGISLLTQKKPGWEQQLHSGIGIFYSLSSSAASRLSNGYPYLRTRTAKNVVFPLTESNALPVAFSTEPPYSTIFSFDPELKNPRVYEWNIGIDQQLGGKQSLRIDYVGSNGTRLLHREILLPAIGLNPNFTKVELINNRAHSHYDALQMRLERRFSSGPQLLLNYTLGRSNDNGSSLAHPVPYYTYYDPNLDQGPSDFDVRQTVTSALTFAMPSISSTPWLKRAMQDWSIANIFLIRSAMPINVVTGADPLSMNYYNAAYIRPNSAPGARVYLTGSQYPGGKRINPLAFSDSGSSLQGQLKRNALRGFGMWQEDIGIQREFTLSKELRLRLKIEVFNLLNHPNFGDPGSQTTLSNYLTNANFGLSTASLSQSLGQNAPDGGFNPLYEIGGPRSIQMALRLAF